MDYSRGGGTQFRGMSSWILFCGWVRRQSGASSRIDLPDTIDIEGHQVACHVVEQEMEKQGRKFEVVPYGTTTREQNAAQVQ